MPNYEMTQSGGIYLYRWHDGQYAGLSIQIDKLHEDNRGNPTAEILVKYPPIMPHVHQTRYSLLSTRSRKEVANYCKGRVEGPDWDWILEVVSIQTVRQYRQGEPVVRLGDVPAPESLTYRLPPYLVDRSPNVLYGYGGLGKSYIAAYLSTIVQEAYPVGEMVPEPGNTLYLDYEASQEIQSMRFRYVYRGLELDPDPSILYRFCYLPLEDDIQHIQQIVIEQNIQLIVVDSAGPACGGEPEKSGPTINFFTALRSLRITSLIVAHKSKHDKGPWPFGSIYWWNYGRNLYEIKKAQDTDSDTIHVALLHRKANDDRHNHPRGMRLQFFPGAVTFSAEDTRDIPEFDSELSNKDLIREALGSGAMTVNDIADETGMDINTVRTTLNRNKTVFCQVGTNLGRTLWGISTGA